MVRLLDYSGEVPTKFVYSGQEVQRIYYAGEIVWDMGGTWQPHSNSFAWDAQYAIVTEPDIMAVSQGQQVDFDSNVQTNGDFYKGTFAVPQNLDTSQYTMISAFRAPETRMADDAEIVLIQYPTGGKLVFHGGNNLNDQMSAVISVYNHSSGEYTDLFRCRNGLPVSFGMSIYQEEAPSRIAHVLNSVGSQYENIYYGGASFTLPPNYRLHGPFGTQYNKNYLIYMMVQFRNAFFTGTNQKKKDWLASLALYKPVYEVPPFFKETKAVTLGAYLGGAYA